MGIGMHEILKQSYAKPYFGNFVQNGGNISPLQLDEVWRRCDVMIITAFQVCRRRSLVRTPSTFKGTKI